MSGDTEQELFIKKAKKLEARIKHLWDRHERLQKIFSKFGPGGGHIDDKEKKRLDGITALIESLDEKLKEGYAAHHIYIDPEPIHGEASLVLGEIKDFREDDFFDKFHVSLNLWASSLLEAMNAVRNYMVDYDGNKNGQLVAADVLVIGILIAPAITFVGTAHTVAGIVEKGIKTNFSPKKSDKPTINEIQQARRIYLKKFAADTALHKSMFKGFIVEYMYINKIDMESWSGWEIPFADACRGFAGTNLISSSAYEKEFVSEILRNTQNDDRNEADDEAGEAELTWLVERDNWTIPDTAFEFYSMKRQLDDVSKAVLEGVKTIFAGRGVIDLPVQININVVGKPPGPDNERNFRATRSSRAMGNVDFKFTGGNKEVYDEFMRQKVYDRIKVKDLNYDD